MLKCIIMKTFIEAEFVYFKKCFVVYFVFISYYLYKSTNRLTILIYILYAI